MSIGLAPPFIHPTALIEADVLIAPGTRVWDHVHIRHSTSIGLDCSIGGKSHVSYEVRIGDRVKINSFVYICTAVEIGDGVMVSAGVIFTNDRFPRAATPDLQHSLSSDPDENTERTFVQEGATIGAGAIIGPGLTIGRFAMIGMGSVVTRDVLPFHLCFGNPARCGGFVCRCGSPLVRFTPGSLIASGSLVCQKCRRSYQIGEDSLTVRELSFPSACLQPSVS